jgi:hypothetical protein
MLLTRRRPPVLRRRLGDSSPGRRDLVTSVIFQLFEVFVEILGT